jgi:hypothetical protein
VIFLLLFLLNIRCLVQVDEFEIEAVTLTKLRKVRIGHDGHGMGAGWFLDKVVVKQLGTDKYDSVFECNR